MHGVPHTRVNIFNHMWQLPIVALPVTCGSITGHAWHHSVERVVPLVRACDTVRKIPLLCEVVTGWYCKRFSLPDLIKQLVTRIKHTRVVKVVYEANKNNET